MGRQYLFLCATCGNNEATLLLSEERLYYAALFFGLIHGLGFSNYLRSLLGAERGLVLPLFSFNVGIEVGQIIIVAIIMLLTKLVVDLIGLPRREWHVLLSGAGLGISLVLMFERFPF